MTIYLKTISELQELTFYIPDYQRGYRWTKEEVQTLLEDIDQFDLTGKNGIAPWYCLQPLVVKETECGYEVIDGQQRLTTIFLILKFLKQNENLFKLEYKNLDSNALNNPENIEISSCGLNDTYIKEAYDVIKNFAYNDDFEKKLLNHTKFIWYEAEKENAIDVFRRLNVGKIELKEAELIKALFLNKSNFPNEVSESVYLRQLEIANEWDNVEKKLQNDAFWYFLSNDAQKDNRITFILNLITQSPKNLWYSYFEIYKNYSDKSDFINKEWSKIKHCFYRLEEWFKDCELHNKIGYLQIFYQNKNLIQNLYHSLDTIKTKKEFDKKISQEIFNTLDEMIKKELKKEEKKDLSDFLDSLTKGNNDNTIRKVLLLHNILTACQSRTFFRFDLYKKEKWDIEHIASAAGDAIPKKKEDMICWLNVTLNFLKTDNESDYDSLNNKYNFELLKDNIEKKAFDYFEKFSQLYVEINKKYLENIEIDDERIDSLANLVLLDQTTNRSYKNRIFPIKREEIIKLDKTGIIKDDTNQQKNIRFLLPCTRNVFLKYYTDKAKNLNKWEKQDMENYANDIKEKLEIFHIVN